jgi:cation transport ATPase
MSQIVTFLNLLTLFVVGLYALILVLARLVGPRFFWATAFVLATLFLAGTYVWILAEERMETALNNLTTKKDAAAAALAECNNLRGRQARERAELDSRFGPGPNELRGALRVQMKDRHERERQGVCP